MKNKGLSFFPDYEREPVPYAERHGWFRLGMVWIGIAINLSAVLLGSQIGSGLMLKDAFVATLAGSFLVAIIAALCAYVGAATGQSTAMISRYAFGEYGSRLIVTDCRVAR